MAEKASLSVDAVGTIERGQRKVPYRSTVALLGKALALSAEELAVLEGARIAGRGSGHKFGVAHNLQAVRTSFVGRAADVATIGTLLRRSRFVTVTGSGGVGKTRVALEAAWTIVGCDPWDELWFVDLAGLISGDDISDKIASTIRPPLTHRAETLHSLVSVLAKRRMLLIFDGCEHLVTSLAYAADAILAGCPHVSILATSRERLNVAGEFVYRLPSLAIQDAADLFIQRAQSADQHLSFDGKNMPVVVDIVRRLDGIPLAIELIAAQLPALGLDILRTRLDEEFRVPSGRHDLPARQQTVEATIRWSYDLLTREEQLLLLEVSVFFGGFSLRATEAVCGSGTLHQPQVLPLLLSLANKSLIDVENSEGHTRYSLLDSVRTFGLQRLREIGSYDDVARRHIRWLAAIARDVEDTTAILSRELAAELLPDFDNLRAAVAWSLAAESVEDRLLAVEVLTGLHNLWDRMGRRREHRQQLELALEKIDDSRYPLEASSLLRSLMIRVSQEKSVVEIFDRAVELCERSGDRFALAKLLVTGASSLAFQRETERAEACATRAHDLLVATGKQHLTFFAYVLFAKAQARVHQGRFEEARSDVDAAEKIVTTNGDHYVFSFLYIMRAEIEYAAGNKQLALEYLERMLDDVADDGHVVMHALGRIPGLRLQLGDIAGAIAPLCKWLKAIKENDMYNHGELEFPALALVLRGQPITAARLLGCAQAFGQRSPFARSNMHQDAYLMLQSSLDRQLSQHRLSAALDEGARLDAHAATDEALAALGCSGD